MDHQVRTEGEATNAGSSAEVSENERKRVRAERSGSDSQIARHGSSASESGLHMYRCDSGASFASSAAGNRGSFISNEAAPGISSEVLEVIVLADVLYIIM